MFSIERLFGFNLVLLLLRQIWKGSLLKETWNVNDAESYILTLQFLKLAVDGIIAF